MLIERYGGGVTAEQVVEFARDPNTALHASFMWDDSQAAHRYRLLQAQDVLRVMVRTVAGPTGVTRVRAFVCLSSDRHVGGGLYRPVAAVLESAAMTDTMMRDALKELQALRTKYGHLTQLAKVWSSVDALA